MPCLGVVQELKLRLKMEKKMEKELEAGLIGAHRPCGM